MSEELNKPTIFDIFGAAQQTYEEAQKKVAEETSVRATYLRINKDGKHILRILPLAPEVGSNGGITMPRKGYEYPSKSMVLNIKAGVDKKGKDKINFVGIINTNYVFPDQKIDLIDTFTEVALEKYANDEKICKKIKDSGFNGGLKWDSQRNMYVLDLAERAKGIQLLQVSFSQYKEMEGRKMDIWAKLLKNNPKHGCPISSINDAYPMEITRTTENTKAKYAFNIDIISGADKLSPEELQLLLDTPRIPSVIYRYSRFHLEASIVFLEQFSEALGISVLEDERVRECIEKIKLLLPSDDHSHFSFDGGADNGTSEANNIDNLWNKFDELESKKLGDNSEEGQDLRGLIREFIEDQELNIVVRRGKSNYDLLTEIDNLMNDGEIKTDAKSESEIEENNTLQNEQSKTVVEIEDDEDKAPADPRDERNEDTNEPAVRVERRRAARPERRR